MFYMYTDEFIAKINPLIPFIKDEKVYDKKITMSLCTMTSTDLEKLISMLCNQKSFFDDINFSMYKINILTDEFDKHVDFYNKNKSRDSYSIQYNDQHLLLNIMSIESLTDYMISIKNRYIFLPLSLFSVNLGAGHQTCLIIDKKKKESYLYDPNGKTTFFDNIFLIQFKTHISKNNDSLHYQQKFDEELFDIISENKNMSEDEKKIFFDNMHLDNNDSKSLDLSFDGETKINKLLEGYFNELNLKTGIDIKFIEQKKWNQKQYLLNKSFGKQTVLKDGHCVITTLLFIHYLFLVEDDIKNVIEILGTLNHNELAYVINGYGTGISDLLKENNSGSSNFNFDVDSCLNELNNIKKNILDLLKIDLSDE